MDDLDTTEVLLKAGADPNIEADMNYKPAEAGLPSLGPSRGEFPFWIPITVKDWNGWTPLHCGAALGYEEYVRLLLEHGARADITDDKGRMPLDIARLEGHGKIVALLEEWIKEHPQPEEGDPEDAE